MYTEVCTQVKSCMDWGNLLEFSEGLGKSGVTKGQVETSDLIGVPFQDGVILSRLWTPYHK